MARVLTSEEGKYIVRARGVTELGETVPITRAHFCGCEIWARGRWGVTSFRQGARVPFNLFVKAEQDTDAMEIPLVLINGSSTDPCSIIRHIKVKIPPLKAGRKRKEKILAMLDCSGSSLLSLETQPEAPRLYVFTVISTAEIIALFGIVIAFLALIGLMLGLLLRVGS